MKKTLKFDERNVGGRDAIRKRVLDHHAAIVQMKPTFDSQKPPKPHVDAGVDPEKKRNRPFKTAPDFSEVMVAFKKVANKNKGYIDNKEPEAATVFKKFIPKQAKKEKFISQEHEFHLKSQRRKIENMGKSFAERKKNAFDPIAHPSLFFRKPAQGNKDVNIDFMFSTVTGVKPSVTTYEPTKLKNKVTARPLSAQVTTQGSMNETMNDTKVSTVKKTANKFIAEIFIPTFHVSNDEDYRQMKRAIIDIIVDNRIYKNQDLKALAEKVKKENAHVGVDKIDQMFKEIEEDFDS